MSAVMVIEDLNLLFIVFCGTKALILLCMHACMRQLGCATVWLILTSVLFDDARLSSNCTGTASSAVWASSGVC